MKKSLSVSERLLLARGLKKRTDVAKATNIPTETLRGYENGNRFPSRKNMIILSNYYKIPIQELFF